MSKKQKTKKKKALKFILFSLSLFVAIIFIRVVYFETFEYHPTPFVGRLLGVEDVSVRLKWLHNAQFAGIYSAEENGYFKNRDLRVILLERDFSKESITDEVAEGKVTFGITSALDVLNAVSQGKKIKAIAAVYQHTPGAAASLKGSNITAPLDIQGKKIGISSDNSTARLFYDYLINRYEIPKNSVTFIEVGPRQADALIDGTVDILGVYRTDEPYALTSKGISFRLMLPEHHGLDLYGDVIITSTDTIEKNPELVEKFLNGVIHGWEWAFENEEETLSIAAKYAKSPYDDFWRQRYILANSEPLIKSDDGKIGVMKEERWEEIVETLYRYDVLPNKVQSSDIFTNEFVK